MKIAMILLCLFLGSATKNKTTIYLAGDSTMSQKAIAAYPETGWGMPFSYFFDSTIQVDNKAKNGRSTRTFISENLWKPIVENLKKGDYVFIQFGHNDESKEKTDRYTSPEEYKDNLKKFVEDTRNKGAIPVLLTPVSRRQFDSLGKVKETHLIYSAAVREVAKNLKVVLIDMDTKSRELYQEFGPDNSKLLFLQLTPGEHPNYPAGKNDNTHFNELGARKIAQIVLHEIKMNLPDLALHIRPPLPVKK